MWYRNLKHQRMESRVAGLPVAARLLVVLLVPLLLGDERRSFVLSLNVKRRPSLRILPPSSKRHHTATTMTTESSHGSSSPSTRYTPQHEHLFPFLSVLIPAYNEEDRLGRTLQSYHDYLACHPYWSGTDNTFHTTTRPRCQIVVADDGSTDQTTQVVQNFNASRIPISCVSLPSNGGKGAALAYGMQHILTANNASSSSWILTADADGSAPLASNLDACIHRVETWYQQGKNKATSTRMNMTDNSQPETNMRNDKDKDKQTNAWDDDNKMILVAGYRTYASAAPKRLVFRWGFRTVVRFVLGNLGVRDSQCGFKLLSAPAAAVLYRDLHLPSWSHDVEVLYRARHCWTTAIILEQSVTWEDQEGSKLTASPGGVLAVSLQMFLQVLLMRWKYQTGEWQCPENAATNNLGS